MENLEREIHDECDRLTQWQTVSSLEIHDECDLLTRGNHIFE